jgi:hypothetical protein
MPDWPPRARVQYLESLDSVRLSRLGPAGGTARSEDLLEADATQLQVLLEVLMTLAMGRDIVVPQSYAFDSWAFLSVAGRVLDARDVASSKDRPFRLHVFGPGVHTYRDGVRRMLGRVHDSRSPFVSSLLPGLVDLEQGELTAMGEDLDRLWSWADGEGEGLGPLMRRVDEEFRAVSPFRSRPLGNAVTLGERLMALASTGGADAGPAHPDDRSGEVHAMLATAVSRLDATRPAAFGQRSRLRQNQPWPNDPAGRTPEELVGGRRALDLVVEFVDTLYNRVIVDSIGAVEASFVTAVGRDDEHQLARAAAQRQALPAALPMTAQARQSDQADPVFELRVTPEALTEGAAARRETRALLDSATAALGGLMELRGEQGTRQGHKARFWASLDRLDAAAREGNRAAMEKALQQHLRLVAGAMNDKAKVSFISSHSMQMSLAGLGGAAPVVALAAVALPPAVATAVGAALGGLGAMTPGLAATGDALRARGKTRRLATALGELIQVPGGESA